MIIRQEREAVSRFDGDMLVALSERRVVCHQALATLEKESRRLLIEGGAPESMTVEAFVELYAGADAARFQSLRRGLYERMAHIEQDNAENYIRMHAAYDVTNSVLQQIGAVEAQQTYGPGNVR
jgi:hypothetical protein